MSITEGEITIEDAVKIRTDYEEQLPPEAVVSTTELIQYAYKRGYTDRGSE